MALEQLPALAARGPLARRLGRWPGAVTAAVSRSVSAAPTRWQPRQRTLAPGGPAARGSSSAPAGRGRPRGPQHGGAQRRSGWPWSGPLARW